MEIVNANKLSIFLDQKYILENYSFYINSGHIFAIMGKNGVGKTTLLSCLVGNYKISSGSLEVKKTIGYVPQLFDSVFSYSVMDMILMGRARHVKFLRTLSLKDYEIALKYLKLLKLEHLKDRSFNVLSGGQKQLVIIAQALTSECDMLILDEPCSGLDYKNQAMVLQVLKKLNKDFKLTIVFTTHTPQHALEIADDILLMQSSQDYICGTKDKILCEDHLSKTYDIKIEKAQFISSDKFLLAPRFDEQIHTMRA